MIDFLKKKQNSRYEVIVPGTSANLGPGFDALGIAWELYNHFFFKRSDKYEYINIKEEYQNEDNLVIVSAKETFKYLKKKEIPFALEIKENVPVSRGLGSSATCILAGVIGAMLLGDARLSDEEIVKIATKVEGHPDNIVPAYYGSLCAIAIDNDDIVFSRFNVSRDLCFTALIPPFSLETKHAREVLPHELSYQDAIYNMSRALIIPNAFETGDLGKLNHVMKDKMHEPYRYPLIKDSEVFREFAIKNELPLCISGSGSTLLLISKENELKQLSNIKLDNEWRYLELKVARKGTRWVEYDD